MSGGSSHEEPGPVARPAAPPGPPEGRPTPVFRWSGAYWGYLAGTRLHDRHGRHAGWIEPTPSQVPRWRGHQGEAPRPAGFDVFLLDGHFLGEVCDGAYVLRDAYRADPVTRAARAAVHDRAPLDLAPDRQERDVIDGWRDVLPWPIRPPLPPRI